MLETAMNVIVNSNIELVDQSARDKFSNSINSNFSVIASAGVGKTTAIVQRIINIAKLTDYNSKNMLLPKLIVVTYAQKAADEMKHRVYQAILKENISQYAINALHKAFFGTIHSYCLRLIQSYGSQIGLPSNLALITNDEDLWQEFTTLQLKVSTLLPKNYYESLKKYIDISKILNLARRINPKNPSKLTIKDFPNLDLTPLLQYAPKNKKLTQGTEEALAELRNWNDRNLSDPIALELPIFTKGDQHLKSTLAETFSPLWNWLGETSYDLALRIAVEFQAFRVKKGFLTYDDMICFAKKITDNPTIKSIIHRQDYHIILDEAQDTDKQQFEVLLACIQKHDNNRPLPGRFCMVGDPQQAIYSSRADLPTYLEIHNDLVQSKIAENIVFSVTMRCDQKIVDHCNSIFSTILKSKGNNAQIDFVTLNSRPWANIGFVWKIILEKPTNIDEANTLVPEVYEADLIAQKLKAFGFPALKVSNWSEVAILAPRKSWLIEIARSLEKLGIPAQVHSRDEIKGDNPAFAWLVALLHIMHYPNDSLEVMGILREIFAHSDDEIAWYVHQKKDEGNLHPLNIFHKINDHSPIAKTLQLLKNLRDESLDLSLSDFVKFIIEKIQLKERLYALPDYDYGELHATLDAIFVKSIFAEEQAMLRSEWVDFLKMEYDSQADHPAIKEDHIQLYTSHKAKGLEWPVVIVPYLFRAIHFPIQEYPQIFDIPGLDKPRIAVSSHPNKKEWDDLFHAHRIAELERLLYVTATRAKNTLIWIDDEALFKNEALSFAFLLEFSSGRANRNIWNQLQSHLPTYANVAPDNILESNSTSFDVNPFDTKLLNHAKFAQILPKHILPSKLADENLLEDLVKLDHSPLEYGIWWHSLMESIPWYDKSSWNDHFSRWVDQSTAPSRSQNDWNRFINSSLFSILQKSCLSIRSEFPFLFKNPLGELVEGRIDLLVYDPNEDNFLLIDWKTDFFDNPIDAASLLKQFYFQQLNLYKTSIQSIYKKHVQTCIYNTTLGQLIDISQS